MKEIRFVWALVGILLGNYINKQDWPSIVGLVGGILAYCLLMLFYKEEPPVPPPGDVDHAKIQDLKDHLDRLQEQVTRMNSQANIVAAFQRK